MKTIGMLGGMSWESTVSYYRAINQGVKAALGGLHSAKIILYSVDFQEIERLQHQGDWGATADILVRAARSVEQAGADGLIICTNTMHKVADRIEHALSIPLMHIADATARQLLADGVRRVGLLGTRFTMEQPFYRDRLQERYGIDVLVPEMDDRERVHQIIYTELCLGQIHEASRREYLRIIADLQRAGAEAVILGCTEIALLVQPEQTEVPLYDTTAIHAADAVNFLLAD
ncbi:aspartate/glutamate racemase family protein [Sedimenticola selenatireducens]|uniref:aspartate/glutamate racemase family protein n=1 Tax=Sedimenticola selenatireducens TaxID=191960 RepID=UPI003F4AB163